MKRTWLLLILLLVAGFSLATWLDPRLSRNGAGRSGGSGGVLALLLGDARKVFADRMFAKADAYYHRGKYPSIFELNARQSQGTAHLMGEACPHDHDHADDHGHDDHDHSTCNHPEHQHGANATGNAGAGERLDWVSAFGRRFVPHQHVHLEGGREVEMLPWLRLSAELDPHRTELYAVTAYWLRDRLGRADQAERFLRDGLKANPRSPELLYELGRLLFDARKDLNRARNLWVNALTQWDAVEAPKPDDQRNDLLRLQILSGLARVELEDGQTAKAIEYLRRLKAISPSPDAVQERINEIEK